jgi:hypothetical protein
MTGRLGVCVLLTSDMGSVCQERVGWGGVGWGGVGWGDASKWLLCNIMALLITSCWPVVFVCLVPLADFARAACLLLASGALRAMAGCAGTDEGISRLPYNVAVVCHRAKARQVRIACWRVLLHT